LESLYSISGKDIIRIRREFKFQIVLPSEFINRVKSQDYIDAEVLLKALEEPSPVSIRINSCKWDRIPLSAEHVPWSKSGYYLDKRPSYTLDPLFHSGCYYPQEASGMFLELALHQAYEPIKNVRVLDLCGAPGGKSTLLSEIIGPDSLLVANEVIASRAFILAETITKWGSDNTIVTQNDPSAFGRLSGYFDIVLVDAPCSGEGMFRTEIARMEWSGENASHCSDRQKRILMDIWPALKANGILIYSTCTFNPDENEKNIKWLISRQEAEIVRLDIRGFPGIKEIDYNGIYGYGFYPGKIKGEGFFISVIRKKARQEKKMVRNQRFSELKPGKPELEMVKTWTTFSEDRILRRGDEIYSVPGSMDDYLHLFQNLKVIKSGTKIFSIKKSDYLPSHDLALSCRLKTDIFNREEISLNKAVSYLRRDNLMFKDQLKGWVLVAFRGINLGFIKNLGSRANNYYPVEWRIRMNIPESGNMNIVKWADDE
jgi:16S rRNA C967 or C1407 C5-methylase (RsmB/RsmF family)/NOL1/NOP2/fmu family ribosome biogenesis protein